MGKKVTIIGAGSVGSTIAYTMAVNGIATEIVMIDINEAKAMGEALDIRQGVPFCPPVSIYAGSYPEAENSDIVILTSGVAPEARSEPSGAGSDQREYHQGHYSADCQVRPQRYLYYCIQPRGYSDLCL